MNRVGCRTGPASLCEAERPRLCLPREAAGRRHRLQPRRRALAGHRTCGRSGLGLPASSADRNKHLLFKPPRPSCFVMEIQDDSVCTRRPQAPSPQHGQSGRRDPCHPPRAPSSRLWTRHHRPPSSAGAESTCQAGSSLCPRLTWETSAKLYAPLLEMDPGPLSFSPSPLLTPWSRGHAIPGALPGSPAGLPAPLWALHKHLFSPC